MKKMPRSRLFTALAGAALLAGCDRPPADGSVSVSHVWIRLPAVKDRPGGAYFRMEAGSEGTRLLGISSPSIRRIELHETLTKGGRTKMERRKEIEFPSRGELVFEPGGRHAMLLGIDSRLKPGDVVALTFSFNVAPPITVEAKVHSAGDEAPHGGH